MDEQAENNARLVDSLDMNRWYRLVKRPSKDVLRNAGELFFLNDPEAGYRFFAEEVNRSVPIWRASLHDHKLRQDENFTFDDFVEQAAENRDLAKALVQVSKRTLHALGWYWDKHKRPKYMTGEFFLEAARILRRKADEHNQKEAADLWETTVCELLECKPEWSDIETATPSPSRQSPNNRPVARVLYVDDILDYLKRIEPNHIVVVASGDGFLEISSPALAESVAENIRRGLSYWYVFPPAEYQETGALEGDLQGSVVRRLTTVSERNRVRFFEVDRSLPAGLGRKQRTVLLLDAPSKEVVEAFHYLRTPTEFGDKIDGSVMDCWLPMPRDDARDLWQTICDHSRPVYPGIGNAPRATPLQRAYVSHFERNDLLDAYDELKHPSVVDDIATAIMDWAFHTRERVSILDIGGSDGRVLARILNRCRQTLPGLIARPTVLDAANIREPHQTLVQYAPETKFDTAFENFNRPSESYDIVLAVHAWYVMDPWQLFRALRLVRSDGVMIVVQATRDMNGLSVLSRLVDEHEGSPVVPRVRPINGVNMAPHRVYAEDIWEFLQATLGESSGVTRTRRKQMLSSRLFIDSEGTLTPTAQQLLAAFCSDQLIAEGVLKQDEHDSVIRKAASVLADMVCPESQSIPVHYDMISLFPAKIRP